MNTTVVDSPAAWMAEDLRADRSWIFTLDERAQNDLREAVRTAYRRDKPLFEYTRSDGDPGTAAPVIAKAFAETKHGRGVALVRGLPREGLSEDEFRLLTWLIGLHT